MTTLLALLLLTADAGADDLSLRVGIGWVTESAAAAGVLSARRNPVALLGADWSRKRLDVGVHALERPRTASGALQDDVLRPSAGELCRTLEATETRVKPEPTSRSIEQTLAQIEREIGQAPLELRSAIMHAYEGRATLLALRDRLQSVLIPPVEQVRAAADLVVTEEWGEGPLGLALLQSSTGKLLETMTDEGRAVVDPADCEIVKRPSRVLVRRVESSATAGVRIITDAAGVETMEAI